MFGWVSAAIGAAVGAIAGAVGQVVSDVVTSVATGEFKLSSLETYAGAVIGGAAGGAVLGATGSVDLANAVTGFTTTAVSLTLEKWTGKNDMSYGEIAVNAVVDGAISYGLGKLPGVKGITKGRNNQNAVYRAGLTKIRKGIVKRMSKSVLYKGIKSSIVAGLGLDIHYGLKQAFYNPIKKLLTN